MSRNLELPNESEALLQRMEEHNKMAETKSRILEAFLVDNLVENDNEKIFESIIQNIKKHRRLAKVCLEKYRELTKAIPTHRKIYHEMKMKRGLL